MRLVTVAVGLFLALTSMVAAQVFNSPKALLEAFYQPYFTDEFAEDESVFRSAALNGLYADDDARTPIGEMGALDFDPYVDGQDYEIDNLVIGEPVLSGNSAQVNVSFDNFGRPTALIYDLVFENGGWKIDDVASELAEYPYRLSAIFAASAGAE
ncbi:DUF3828 domain-containing protein [Devosia faecipullorum]|uniref:DUF3828 domain-containing protein n=1 Tax=Devosia faecipullorum TaxID=2755039 RepID=UPI00187B5FC4|nr:DUF3828 domain-containing protein [Devosia faecipullorum]MBE7732246.1 DUF3828 domain-containing protein [Devosia faecipullorum]